MTQPWPIAIRDESGTTRLEGDAIGTPGGAQEFVIQTGDIIVADGAGGQFSLVHDSGATLLDYTNPANPLFAAAGTYAVSYYVYCQAPFPVSGSWTIDFDIQPGSGMSNAIAQGFVATLTPPELALNFTTTVPAGSGLLFHVYNQSGLGGSLTFSLGQLVIVRLG